MIRTLLRRLLRVFPASGAPEVDLSREPPYALEFIAQVDHFVFHSDSSQLFQLDHWMRRFDSPWSPVRPETIPSLLSRSSNPALDLRALTAHSSGYVREAALRELVRRDESDLLRFLLFRANDWVEPIARFASAEAISRVERADLPTLADSLPLLVALSGQARRNHSALLDLARTRVRSDGGVMLVENSERWSHAVRRLAYSWVLPSIEDPEALVVEQALAEPDPVTRAAAIARLSEIASESALDRIERIARRSRGAVRAAALDALGRRAIRRTEPLLISALLDSSRAVRRVARSLALTLDPEFDLHDLYVTSCTGPAPVPGAIHGLAEVSERSNTESDGEALRPLLQSPSIALRRAALESFAFLKGHQAIPECLTALADPWPGVVRVAAAALERQRTRLDHDVLWNCFVLLRHSHARARCMRLIAHGPKWAVLQHLLLLTEDTSEVIRGLACAHLQEWCKRSNRRFLPPTTGEREACHVTLERAAPSIPKVLAIELEFAIRMATADR